MMGRSSAFQQMGWNWFGLLAPDGRTEASYPGYRRVPEGSALPTSHVAEMEFVFPETAGKDRSVHGVVSYLAAFREESGGEPLMKWGDSEQVVWVVDGLTVHFRLRFE